MILQVLFQFPLILLTLAHLTVTFFDELCLFCFVFFVLGMNLNKRELNEHVEFESQTYYAAFAAELEACAQPMWGLLTHCKVKVSPDCTRSVSPVGIADDHIWCIRSNIRAVLKVGGSHVQLHSGVNAQVFFWCKCNPL